MYKRGDHFEVPMRALLARRSEVSPAIRFARSLHALLLHHLPQDCWRRRLRDQPRRRRQHDKSERREKHRHLSLRERGKRTRRSPAKRHFCLKCGSALWLWYPRWPQLIHPHASAIDTPLPKPPEVVEATLAYAANWVDVPKGKKHVHCREWPNESLKEWHQRHQLIA